MPFFSQIFWGLKPLLWSLGPWGGPDTSYEFLSKKKFFDVL
jgi:hypothetical protein